MTVPRTVTIDVYDDPICPNCYMCYTELGNAIREAKEKQLPLTYEIRYHPLRLVCPEALADGQIVDKAPFLELKFGPENFKNAQISMNQWAEKRNTTVKWDGKLGSSTNAFRLSLKAFQLGGKMAQFPLHGALFNASIVEGKEVSDINLLAEVAASVGIMSRDAAFAFLQSDELKDEVNIQIQQSRARGISRVPTVIFNKKYKLDGAHCRDLYLQMLQKLAVCTGCPSNAPSPMPPAAQPLVPAV